MEFSLRKIAALKNILAKRAYGLTGKRFRITEIRGEDSLAYTADNGTIYINFNHNYLNNLEDGQATSFIHGLFAHEIMHQILSNFGVLTRSIKKHEVSNTECQVFKETNNILEDAYIENFACEYLGDELLKSLSYMRAICYKHSPALDELKTPYEQFVYASIQFGDAGILKGKFTDPQAEKCFGDALPIMCEGLYEHNAERRVRCAERIMEIARPLWETEDSKMMDEIFKRLKDMMGKRGGPLPSRGKPLASGGSSSDIPKPGKSKDSEESESTRKIVKRRMMTMKRFSDSKKEDEENEKSESSATPGGEENASSEAPETPSEAGSEDNEKVSEESSASSEEAEGEPEKDDGELAGESGNESENEADEGSESGPEGESKSESEDESEGDSKGNSESDSEDSSEAGSDGDSGSNSDGDSDGNSDGDSDDGSDGEADGSHDGDTEKSKEDPDMEPASHKIDYSKKPNEDIEEEIGPGFEDELLMEMEVSEEDAARMEEELRRAEDDIRKESETVGSDLDLDLDVPSGYKNSCKGKSCMNIKVYGSKNDRTQEVYNKYIESMSKEISRLTTQLKRIFEKDIEEKMYKSSGKVSVKRLMSGRVSTNVFVKKKLPGNKYNLSVCILVDESGSMSCAAALGSKVSSIVNAKKCAIGLAEVFAKLGIPLSVIGFSADETISGKRYSAVHRHYLVWKNTLSERMCLLNMNAYYNNFDGYSIRYASKFLSKAKTEHKILIVISDGQPLCGSYRTNNGIMDTKMAIKEASKDAVVCGVLVGIGEAEVHKEMYGYNFIHIQKPEDMFDKIAGMIAKQIKEW